MGFNVVNRDLSLQTWKPCRQMIHGQCPGHVIVHVISAMVSAGWRRVAVDLLGVAEVGLDVEGPFITSAGKGSSRESTRPVNTCTMCSESR
jgi:hypothetical protein